jgi:hypothetical protein
MKFWFKTKYFGIGWYPSSWEGWAIILVFSVLTLSTAYFIQQITTTRSDFLFIFLTTALIILVLLFWIISQKGEKLKWRW